MILAFLFGRTNFWDDAYITFRYSRNLANGYGITWNITDAPTQGSTTFSFVLLIAAGLKLGIPVELTAVALNITGVVLTVVTLHLGYRMIFEDKSLVSILPTFVILFYAGTIELVSSGMETVFWTGILYASLFLLLYYREQKQEWSLILFFIFSYLACLTRPESAIIIALWFIYLIAITEGKQRLYTFAGITIFGIAGLIYVMWLNSYFGYILPNSFYIKVGSGLNKEGVEYVFSFIFFFLIKPIMTISIVGLFFFARNERFPMSPALVFFLLLPFYLFTEPLTGVAFRFLHPASVLGLFLLALGGLYHFRIIWQKIEDAKLSIVINNKKTLSGLSAIIAAGFFFFSFFHFGVTYYMNATMDGLSITPPRKTNSILQDAAQLLREVPGVENTTIVYHDAGVLAYETMAYYIDPVGLNHSLIAREASERGGEWVVDLLMEYDADLMVFYSKPDGHIVDAGHGVVGAYYSNLYLHPEFQDNYIEIAALNYDFAISRWFVRIDSSYKDAFETALDPIAMENPPPIIP